MAEDPVTVIAGLIVVALALVVARWAWRFQVRVLEILAPGALLRRLEVCITAVVVHDRCVVLGVRDQADRLRLQTIVVRLRGDRERVVAILETWCRDGDRLQFDRAASNRRIKLRRLTDDRALSLRLAA
jgi:hypothetical protein